MAKYEFTGTGCGSGSAHVYTVHENGVYWGTQEAQCPDVNVFFVNYYHGNEVWVNGNQLTTATGQPTDLFIQLLPRTGTWGAYLIAHNIINPTVADYLDYFNSTPTEPPTTGNKSIFNALATAAAIIAGAVIIKKRRK